MSRYKMVIDTECTNCRVMRKVVCEIDIYQSWCAYCMEEASARVLETARRLECGKSEE